MLLATSVPKSVLEISENPQKHVRGGYHFQESSKPANLLRSTLLRVTFQN